MNPAFAVHPAICEFGTRRIARGIRIAAGVDDAALALPPEIDPCGENGEFHTFVYDAPVFSRPIAVSGGEVVERDGFVFADVLPE